MSGIWYGTILTKKLPYSAGLRDLEERRAAQAKVSQWQDRLAYINLTLAVLAAFGGIMAHISANMAIPSVNLAQYDFYRERLAADGRPAPWALADLEEFARGHPGDPFAGRVRAGAAPKLALQVEATGDPPIWIALDPPELDRWAGVLERMWARWGTGPGETIAFFDYGSSPLVLLASSGYVGYLRRGAAERLGLNAICNDGVAAMAARMVSIVETVQPSMLILRRDLAVPFALGSGSRRRPTSRAGAMGRDQRS